MSTAEFALVVSIFSVIVASLALGWNVYRDVVLKAHVDVSFAVITIIHESLPHRPQYLNLKVTNFGPGPVNISTIVAKDAPLWRRLLRKIRWAMITPDYTNPMSARLPSKIEVGDKIELLLPYDRHAFLKDGFTHIGVSDYFGRNHWAPGRQLKRAYETWRKDFASEA